MDTEAINDAFDALVERPMDALFDRFLCEILGVVDRSAEYAISVGTEDWSEDVHMAIEAGSQDATDDSDPGPGPQEE